MNTVTLLLLAFSLVGVPAWMAIARNHRRHMKALETLTQSVQSLTTAVGALTQSVDAAVVEINTEDATEAQLSTLATAVDTLTANVNAQAKRLDEAVNPPTVPADPTLPPED